MRGVIDRFEGLHAVVVLDSEEVIDIDLDKIPQGSKEGDVIIIGETIYIDKEETEKRQIKMKDYLDLWED